jgi:hypothetical protein
MPTATSTVTTAYSPTVSLPLKGGPPYFTPTPPSTAANVASLRSLYSSAARAFLHRDIPLTHSLLTSAFSTLHNPASSAPDGLCAHRRKWDILRITLETTVYASPPSPGGLEALPEPLRENVVLVPSVLITSMYSRSLELFTPATHHPKTDPAFLPSQVLLTLILSSMKLECPDMGRGMVEEWLARRGRREEPPGDENGYEKVVEMYCLHVLPRLEQWDYAREFLQYESELPPDHRQVRNLSHSRTL